MQSKANVLSVDDCSVFVSSAVQQMGETRFRYLIHHLRRNLHNHCQTAPVQPVGVSSGVDGACATLAPQFCCNVLAVVVVSALSF